MTADQQIKELQQLEKAIVKGLHAYDRRNELICEMVNAGHRQADLARLINAVRLKMHAPQITPDAIAATMKRAARKENK